MRRPAAFAAERSGPSGMHDRPTGGCMKPLRPPAADGEPFLVRSNGGTWSVGWHSPVSVPEGTPHGANAFCVTADDQVVLISNDGKRWGWPGGRPEGDESWEQTLRREVLEEACALVRNARLLGFAARCASRDLKRVSCWSALCGARMSSCCRGRHGSKSAFGALSHPASSLRTCGWRTDSSRCTTAR
jgi:ADP-ribose pyrophosphatase YjhB (NUDIX family)